MKAFTGYLQIVFPLTPVCKYMCVCMCIFRYPRKFMFSFYKITITNLGNFGVGNYWNSWKLFDGLLYEPWYEFCAAVKWNSHRVFQTVNWISSTVHDGMRATCSGFFWSTHGWQVARCFSLLVDEWTGVQSSAVHMEFCILTVNIKCLHPQIFVFRFIWKFWLLYAFSIMTAIF